MASTSDRKYYARRPFGYAGRQLDRGQIVDLKGLVNDEKLVRLGYVEELPKGTKDVDCRYCSRKFVSQVDRDGHGKKRHADGRVAPTMEPRQKGESDEDYERRHDEFLRACQAFEDGLDGEAEREERVLNEVAPLRLDQTAASRG